MNSRNQRLAIIAGVVVLILAIGVIIAGNGGRLGGTGVDTPTPEVANNNPPPTDVPPPPPTDVPPPPPTDVPPPPPTDVPPAPTDVPATAVPPTDVPPTDVPPTDVPATAVGAAATDVPTEQVAVAPTDVPPTDVPPTDVGATEAPTTEGTPEVAVTEAPTAEVTAITVQDATVEATGSGTPGRIGIQAEGNEPVIQISVTCNLDGSANFTITNIGDAMTEAGRLVVNDPLNPANNRDTAITLGAGGSTGLSLSGTASVQVTYNTAVLQNVLASATGECIPTQTPTNTATNLPTSTSTRTSTNTPLPTNTRTITATPSLTFTPSPTVPTNTPSATNTRRPTNTPSLTYTPSLTLTPSPTVPTNTPSVTNTRAPTNTRTNTPTPSLTFTPSPTVPTNTPSATNTRRPTNTRTNTFTPSPTVPTNTPTQTFTASATLEPSLTYTASATRTPRPTNTVTPTRTLTSTSAPTNTATLTATLPPDAQLSLSVICLSRGENGQARFTISLQTDGTFTNGTYAIDLAGSVTSNGFSKGNLPITLDLAGYAVVRVNYVTPLRPFNQLSATANCSPRPTETPTNTVVPSNTPSRTPVPTDTPTNTPVPTDTPTNTPPPTNTPTNTATPQPDLSYGGQCLNFVSSFTVTNNGGAQSEATNYEVRDANGNVLKSGSFQLAAGASTTIEFSPSYGNIKLFLTSGPTVGEVSSVNCGEPTPTPTSTSTSTPQPDLSYSGQCLNFVSSFTVTNNGGAQSEATNYEVRDANGNVLKSGSFQLAAGASTTIEFSPSYGNIKLFLTSGPTVGEVSSVNCGEPTPTPTSTSTSTPQPDLSYTGQCVEFVSSFTVTNKGGDQSEATNYEVRDANGNVLKSGSFQLAAGASTTIEFSPSYGNIKLFLTSGPTVGEVSSVDCGEPTPTPTSTSTSTPEPSITYEGQCVESVVTFTITNNGGAQSQPMTYAIQDKSGAVVKSGAVTLGATPPDNTATITYGPTNGQVTLFVLEPGKTLTPTKVVDCGEPTPTPTSTPTGTPVSVALAPQGQCKEGVATFIISNTSGSDMPAADTYVIKNQDGVVVQQGSFQLKAGESTTITVAGATGVLTLTAAGTGVTVNTDCSEITTPTATPPVVYRCGETSYDSDGFPIIAPNPEYCQPEENQPISWTPITPGAGFCPDWLLYHTIQTGDWEVFRLGEIPNKPNAKVDITNGVGKDISDVAPARSPDSAWVAFASNRDGNWEIYIVGSDGENLQRMTKNASATDIDPVWSPDGTKVVYESIRSGNWDLYEFDVTNGTERRLTSNPAQDLNAFYSPDGSKLIFQSSRDEQWQIYQLDLNTLQETRLSDGQGTDNDPQVSPDGKHIAFWSTRGTATNSMLYVMDADGKNVQAISSPDGDARNQAYSADGDLIAYQMTINGKLGIYVYQFSTQKTRQVTSDATGDFAPTWYCKSPTIVWTSNADGNNNIYSTNALPMDAAPIDVKTQGSQLTSDPANDQYPQNFPAEENASRKGLLPTINRK